jgi:hypothetical protein
LSKRASPRGEKLCFPIFSANAYRKQGLVRGTDDEDNYATAARKITRKEKDTDEQGKKVARRKISCPN